LFQIVGSAIQCTERVKSCCGEHVTVAGSVVEADGGAGHLSEELVDLLHDKLG
jgi:hypothetical protein